jgi:multiple sugar transport system substrate-binding protein
MGEWRMNKKLVSSVLASVLAIGALTGCVGSNKESSPTDAKDAQTGTEAQTTDAKAGDKTEIVIWTYFETPGQKQMLADLMAGFNSSQESIQVSDQYVPFADFKKQLSVGLTGGELPDLVIMDNPDMASYVSMGLFGDITDLIATWDFKDQYFEGPWSSTMLEGKNYGIPFATNCIALYYNKDMFEAAGITNTPTTWEEFKETAEKLTGNGVNGFGFSGVNTEEGTFQFLPWLDGAGAAFNKIDGEEGIRALTFLQDMAKSGALAKECINWNQQDVCKQFMAGKLAMMENGPWQIPTLKAEAPNLNYGVVLLPKDKKYSSCLGGENIGVVEGENKEAAVEFLKYVAQPEIMKESMLAYGSFPPRQDVANDPVWTDDPIQATFIEQLQYAIPRGPDPQWPSYSIALSTALQEVLTEGKTPEAAAKDAQAKIDAIK